MSLAATLSTNQECAWPSSPQRLEDGELLLVVESLQSDGSVCRRHGASTFTAPCLLPPLASGSRLRFRLRVIQAAHLLPEESTAEQVQECRQALLKRLSPRATAPPPAAAATQPNVAAATTTSLEDLLLQWSSEQDAQRRCALERFEALDESSSARLARSVEAASEQGDSASRGEDPLRDGLNWLLAALEAKPLDTAMAGGTGRRHIEALLSEAQLRCRDVMIDSQALRADCGPLVAFHAEDPARIAFLRPRPSGYWIWEPALQARPRALEGGAAALEGFSSRMVSLLPRLNWEGLNLASLLDFAYGKPGGAIRLTVTCLLVGLVSGFVLAIGRQVGATRWIFGLGGLGGLVGLSLSMVSPGFRLPILATLLSTGIGLLTPTFNTILTNQALPDRDLGLMLQMGGILLAGALAGIGLDWTRSSHLVRTQIQGTARLELGTIDRLLQLPVGFFGREPVGAIILRFHAVRALADGIRELLSEGLLQSLLSVIYLLFMLRISVKLTLLAVVMAMILLLPTALLALEARRLERQAEQARSLATGRSLELISSVSKLRLAGAEMAALRWWSGEYRRSIIYDQAQQARTAVSTLLQTITPHLGTLLLFITITRLVAEAAIAPPGSPSAPNVGQLLGFLSAFGTFIGSMAAVAGLARKAVDLPVDWEMARPILVTTPEVVDRAREPGELSGRLEVDRVSFRYGPDRPLALDRVSLRMEPGEFVALVGASGSGKSSLIRLLLGFDNPEDGVIRYDDQNLAGLRIDHVRRQIGIVMQNAGIFSGSIVDTIAGSAIVSMEEAWEAAELVGLADDIRAMPMGMQTVVPEGGGTFSGGQRQRLAIARALVRRPRILIFDEATSALDNRTQAIVTRSLEALAVSRLVVAHRLSTIVHADRIVALENGRVVQCGTFDELMADSQGLFASLMRRQIA